MSESSLLQSFVKAFNSQSPVASQEIAGYHSTLRDWSETTVYFKLGVKPYVERLLPSPSM